ncbi:hypothetical protein [Mongoliitalea daihaiensis]|uniref:hypothetical protein n=1 Tax=Mongoliitalea daihaiensis TaxID=2782006 RepID=UPI001F3515E2|nr:hypothetical protein [Mongoliitalea daihaiensis]UJP63971.1 hypothetical protein IPZ59_14225 [Mongoliitalea daihaiensis]
MKKSQEKQPDTLIQKLKWLRKNARVTLDNMPPGPGKYVVITVYYNQDKRGYVVQKRRMIKPGLFHYYYDYDKKPEHWTGGRMFSQDTIDEAIKYAKQRISASKKEPEPELLKSQRWVVVDKRSCRYDKTFYLLEEALDFYDKYHSINQIESC